MMKGALTYVNLSGIRRRIAAIVTAGAALVALVPAPAGAAPRCDVAGAATGPTSMHVVLTVHAVEPNASMMFIGCGIVQSGQLVAYESAMGSAAAASADTYTIRTAPYSICYDYDITYTDGSRARYYGCP